MRKLALVMEGDEKIETVGKTITDCLKGYLMRIVNDLEKECKMLKEQAKDQERVNMSLKAIELESKPIQLISLMKSLSDEKLKRSLQKSRNNEDAYRNEIQKEIEKNNEELQVNLIFTLP